jgi:hypothetical protein
LIGDAGVRYPLGVLVVSFGGKQTDERRLTQ